MSALPLREINDQESLDERSPSERREPKKPPILEVKGLSISFHQYTKGLRQQELKVINSLDVDIKAGEVLAVVGSSGSGKSLLAHGILGILPSNALVSGTIKYQGKNLTKEDQLSLRGREISLVPQSVNFLNPLMNVGKQVMIGVKEGNPKQVQQEVFRRYNLGERVEELYPFQVSGGMARRILVSTSVVSGASLVIADEPTPGLDESNLKEALQHFRELADKGCGVMLITHDIEAALTVADRIAVFYAGTTVEIAPVKDFTGRGENLRHPYSKALWRALPQNDFEPIPGAQPLPHELPQGCLFEPRCNLGSSSCKEKLPPATEVRGGMVRCFRGA